MLVIICFSVLSCTISTAIKTDYKPEDNAIYYSNITNGTCNTENKSKYGLVFGDMSPFFNGVVFSVTSENETKPIIFNAYFTNNNIFSKTIEKTVETDLIYAGGGDLDSIAKLTGDSSFLSKSVNMIFSFGGPIWNIYHDPVLKKRLRKWYLFPLPVGRYRIINIIGFYVSTSKTVTGTQVEKYTYKEPIGPSFSVENGKINYIGKYTAKEITTNKIYSDPMGKNSISTLVGEITMNKESEIQSGLHEMLEWRGQCSWDIVKNLAKPFRAWDNQ